MLRSNPFDELEVATCQLSITVSLRNVKLLQENT